MAIKLMKSVCTMSLPGAAEVFKKVQNCVPPRPCFIRPPKFVTSPDDGECTGIKHSCKFDARLAIEPVRLMVSDRESGKLVFAPQEDQSSSRNPQNVSVYTKTCPSQ